MLNEAKYIAEAYRAAGGFDIPPKTDPSLPALRRQAQAWLLTAQTQINTHLASPLPKAQTETKPEAKAEAKAKNEAKTKAEAKAEAKAKAEQPQGRPIYSAQSFSFEEAAPTPSEPTPILPYSHLPQIIEYYDLLHRIATSHPPTADYIRTARIRLARRWLSGDRRISKWDMAQGLLTEIDRDIRRIPTDLAHLALQIRTRHPLLPTADHQHPQRLILQSRK